MKTFVLALESLLVCGGLWLWNPVASKTGGSETARELSEREISQAPEVKFVLGGKSRTESGDAGPPIISSTDQGERILESLKISDPFDQWKALDEMDITQHARWNLRGDLIGRVAEKEGVSAALNLVHTQFWPWKNSHEFYQEGVRICE